MDPYSYDGGGNYDEGMDRRALMSQMQGAAPAAAQGVPRIKQGYGRSTSTPTYEGAPAPDERAIDARYRGRGPMGPLPYGAADEVRAQAPGASETAKLPGPNSPYVSKGSPLALEGFDANKLSSGHRSPKYNFARAAQGLGYGDQDEMLRRLKADDKEGYFTNARFGGSKNDRLIIDGVLDPKFEGFNEFDVFRAAGEGGKGIQWGAVKKGGGGDPRAMPAVPAVMPHLGERTPILTTQPQGDAQSSVFQKIMAQLAAQGGGQLLGMDDEALRMIMAKAQERDQDPNTMRTM